MVLVTLSILAASIVAIARRHDVKLVLLLAGVALAVLGGQPLLGLDQFARSMVAPIVAPICAAMGFAAVLRATGCDRALARELLLPLRRWPWLALPGTVVVAYVFNLAVPSQAATAAALGPVALPLLRASGVPIGIATAALLLGASFGGDLLSPAAQDVLAIRGVAPIEPTAVHRRLLVAGLAGLAVATLWLCRSARHQRSSEDAAMAQDDDAAPRARQRLLAAMPLLPIALLIPAAYGCPGLGWLVAPPSHPDLASWGHGLAVVRVMLLGSVLTALIAWRTGTTPSLSMFFDGMGNAYGSVIALTICAQVFGAGLAASGLQADVLSTLRGEQFRPLLAGSVPLALALLSGSGSGSILATAQVLFGDAEASTTLDRDAALACLAGACGRTLSPAAAVVVCVAGLAQIEVVALLRATAMPALLGAAVSLLVASLC